MDPDGSMENANSGVSHSSLDGANSGAPPAGPTGPATRSDRRTTSTQEGGIFRRSGWGIFG